MDDGKVLARHRAGDARDAVGSTRANGPGLVQVEVRRMRTGGVPRQRGKKRERQIMFADLGLERRPVRAVPGDDRIEAAQSLDEPRFGFDNAHQIEAGGGDGADVAGESGQGHVLRGGPDLDIPLAQALHGGQGKDKVADGAGADEQPAHSRPVSQDRIGGLRFIHSVYTVMQL